MKSKYTAENGQQVGLSVAPRNDFRKAENIQGRHYNITVNVVYPLKPDHKNIIKYKDTIIKFVGKIFNESNPEIIHLSLNAKKTLFKVSLAYNKQKNK